MTFLMIDEQDGRRARLAELLVETLSFSVLSRLACRCSRERLAVRATVSVHLSWRKVG